MRLSIEVVKKSQGIYHDPHSYNLPPPTDQPPLPYRHTARHDKIQGPRGCCISLVLTFAWSYPAPLTSEERAECSLAEGSDVKNSTASS
ncbi:hypothetical protein E2C01_060447 [Portunus trituberculatus]|uniref:Uncharacterized protein n=1 Tax=Portunus trituberculatus TaxID=210409 RepID=A0A5B7H2I4_PORTR|nr:hypothetical protein [Portunus trituberculatus]